MWAAFLAALVAAGITACGSGGTTAEPLDTATGVVGSWSGPSVANAPTPQATAVLLAGARPVVIEAVGSEVRVLEPDGDRLTIRASTDLGAPVVWMQPRVDGDALVVLAQTCDTPVSTVDSVDRDCPSAHTALISFTGDALEPSSEEVHVDGVPRDFASLGDTAAVTTSTGFFVRDSEDTWTLAAEVIGPTCATDEAYVEHLIAASTPTTVAGPGTSSGGSFRVRPLKGSAATDQRVPGRVDAITCAPDGYIASVSSGSAAADGLSLWGSTGVGAPEQKDGPSGARSTIWGQLSRGQWATATVGSRRTVFIDPTSGDWFAATGLKGSESPPYATRSGDRGLVFGPAPGGGTWMLRVYRLDR
ncbi:MAG: hypothetical protein IT194_08755 [Microthrixaceae bacterium]|nr:hypothetical protein [Microthrixaceae bacterium]